MDSVPRARSWTWTQLQRRFEVFPIESVQAPLDAPFDRKCDGFKLISPFFVLLKNNDAPVLNNSYMELQLRFLPVYIPAWLWMGPKCETIKRVTNKVQIVKITRVHPFLQISAWATIQFSCGYSSQVYTLWQDLITMRWRWKRWSSKARTFWTPTWQGDGTFILIEM